MRIGMALLVLVVVGCGGEESGGESTVPEPTVASSASSTSAGQEVDPVIEFMVEGGFAGLSRSLTVAADGSAVVDANGAVSSGAVDVDEMSALLDESGMFDGDVEFRAEGADLQTYTIVFRGVTVVAMDGAVPDELSEVIAALEAAVREVQG